MCFLGQFTAPAGFGKTTLAAEWAESLAGRSGRPDGRSEPCLRGAAWVSLDAGQPVEYESILPQEQAPARFWAPAG